MKYWLLKTEPDTWSWQQQKAKKVEGWDGVRNYQARNFMQEMRLGDLCFFYHTGGEKRIMGLVKVVKTAYPDKEDDRFVLVDVEYVSDFKKPVELSVLKSNNNLQDLKIIRHSRLSVSPVSDEHAKIIMELGN